MGRDADAWHEEQVSRLVTSEGGGDPVAARQRGATLGVLWVVWGALLVLLALLTGHASWWPWAVLVAVPLSAVHGWWFLVPHRSRAAAAERRARAVIPATKAEAYDPNTPGLGG
jgi:hypothetical protein